MGSNQYQGGAMFSSKLLKVLFLVGFACFIGGMFFTQSVCAQTIKRQIVAANPSSVKTQNLPIKIFLPSEIKPSDIIDSGGLELRFDADRSLFYVYKNVKLKPNEIRVFEVEMVDVWYIEDEDMEIAQDKVDFLVVAMEGSVYEDQARVIANEYAALTQEIKVSQVDDSLSREQHIGVYRTNLKAFSHLKNRIFEMERILQRKQGPLTPDMLANKRFKAEAPTKTATWIVIFILLFFLILILTTIILVWLRQSKATQKIISEAGQSTFLDFGDKKSEKKNNWLNSKHPRKRGRQNTNNK